MRRLLLAIAVCALAAAPAAMACSPAILVDPGPGETSAEFLARNERARQDILRANADSIFLARVSAARFVDDRDVEYTLTPFFPLYDTVQPGQAVTMRDSPFSYACEVEPELGNVYVVYAVRQEASWRVTSLVAHADFQDRPPGMPTARDVARGTVSVPLPDYSD